MFAGANAMLRKESFGNYPAMRNILACVYEGSQLPMDAALRVESRYFCDLLTRPCFWKYGAFALPVQTSFGKR